MPNKRNETNANNSFLFRLLYYAFMTYALFVVRRFPLLSLLFRIYFIRYFKGVSAVILNRLWRCALSSESNRQLWLLWLLLWRKNRCSLVVQTLIITFRNVIQRCEIPDFFSFECSAIFQVRKCMCWQNQ